MTSCIVRPPAVLRGDHCMHRFLYTVDPLIRGFQEMDKLLLNAPKIKLPLGLVVTLDRGGSRNRMLKWNFGGHMHYI